MKAILFFIVTASAFAANARLHSYMGQVTRTGFEYHCTISNKTNDTLDMKYVVFTLERRVGKDTDSEIQDRIDRMVRTGETLTISADVPAQFTATSCRFLAR